MSFPNLQKELPRQIRVDWRGLTRTIT